MSGGEISLLIPSINFYIHTEHHNTIVPKLRIYGRAIYCYLSDIILIDIPLTKRSALLYVAITENIQWNIELIAMALFSPVALYAAQNNNGPFIQVTWILNK